MKECFQHIIKTQSIEINFENPEDSIGVQDRIAEIFYDKLAPGMNSLFDEITGEKYLLTIERLEIDCGILSGKNWENDLVENTLRKLKDELRTMNRKNIADESVSAEAAADYFFYFLTNGHLPWNCQAKSLPEIENEIKFDKKNISKLKELLHKNENAVERLVYSFSEKFRLKILTILANPYVDGEESIVELLGNITDSTKSLFQIALIKALIAGESINPETRADELLERISHLKDVISNSHRKKDEKERNQSPEIQSKKPSDQKLKKINEGNVIFIENAGLIILHPFFPQLFETTGLTLKNDAAIGWVDESSQHKAIALLQFLVTGKNDFEEFDLPLNKILCGMNTDDVYKTTGEMKEFEQLQCESLVTDVIKYWAVLKNTGADSFRETFLKRMGKLTPVDEGWLLQVEQKAVDILLNSLPWGIGTIKLPWMKDVLHTEWV